MMYSHHPDAARLLQPLSREHVLTDPSLALFQKVLLVTDGSVTELLCIHAGKMVRAQKISQEIRHDDAPAALGCPVGTPWLHRRILLVTDDARLVFAESAFVLARLSERARRLLLDTDTPIGLLWKAERAEMYREIIDIRREHHPAVAAHFGLSADTPLLTRSYLLLQGGQPLGIITEKFPDAHFR